MRPTVRWSLCYASGGPRVLAAGDALAWGGDAALETRVSSGTALLAAFLLTESPGLAFAHVPCGTLVCLE